MPATRGRGKRAPLTREAVLHGAVRLADAEGLEAVTMRRLAGSLGVEAMSLYHHVPGKESLLDGLVEALMAEIGAEVGKPPTSEDWRADVRDRCLSARRVMLRHPWGPALVGSRRSIPPSVYFHFEGLLASLIRGGFSYHLAHQALHTLGSMILGFVQELFSPSATGEAPDEAADAEAEEELAAMAAVLPHLAAMAASELHATGDPTLGWCDSQVEFEFTLDLLLDGLDRRSRAETDVGSGPGS